eukprot:UN04951
MVDSIDLNDDPTQHQIPDEELDLGALDADDDANLEKMFEDDGVGDELDDLMDDMMDGEDFSGLDFDDPKALEKLEASSKPKPKAEAKTTPPASKQPQQVVNQTTYETITTTNNNLQQQNQLKLPQQQKQQQQKQLLQHQQKPNTDSKLRS